MVGSVARLATADNAELITAHLAGDERAFEELVARYRPRLHAFISRRIGDRERAEDLVQEAFLRIYRHLHRFDPTRKFSTWAYTIAGNLAKNELRNRHRSPLVLVQSLSGTVDEGDARPIEFEAHGTRPDELFHNRHLRHLVEKCVAQLSPQHQEVFRLRELEGKSYEEIAERTGCNLGTVKSRLNRARAHFAELIAPLLD